MLDIIAGAWDGREQSTGFAERPVVYREAIPARPLLKMEKHPFGVDATFRACGQHYPRHSSEKGPLY